LDSIILSAEAGAAFEPDTLNSKIKELEPYSTWPNFFRAAQFVPAVDYVNANRVRVAAMNQTWELFSKYDVVVSPRENTSVTNITGTPSIVVPTGFAIPQTGEVVAAAVVLARRGWWPRAGATRRGGGSRRSAAGHGPAADRHVHHGTDLSGREKPARRACIPAGHGLPSQASAGIWLICARLGGNRRTRMAN
jgi:hypothetical protein